MLQLNRLDKLNLEPSGTIIRAVEFQTLIDAETVIAAAEADAERIRAEAREAYERERLRGYANGVVEGRMEMAEKMIDSVGHAVDYFSGLENKVVDLVLKALKKVIGELDARDRVLNVVRTALAVARNQAHVTLRVAPVDAEIARERLAEITQPYPEIHFLEVVPDSRLAPTACILETELGVIDASLDLQLAAIEKSLTKSLGSRGGIA